MINDSDNQPYSVTYCSAEAIAEHQAFIEDTVAKERTHKQHLTELTASFVTRAANRTITARDICGEYWWDNFTDDERDSAEHLIGQIITEQGLPLAVKYRPCDFEPRRYTLIL